MRTKKSIYNFLSDVFPFLILGILSFVRIRFLINFYGTDVNGYVQLISQIFAYLALADAGFGTAVIYKLYKPLAQNDHEKISSIVNGSKIIFKRIALIIGICGIICTFVIPMFINKGSLTNTFIILIFLLYIVQYLIEYFLIYPFTTLLEADQNQYIFNTYKNTLRISFGILELILMYFRINLIIIMIINIFFTIIYVFLVLRKVKKIYPWLNKDAKADTSTFKMTKDVIVHKISSLIFSKTDPIILSKFSLAYVSIYTSYNYILDFLTNIISKIFNAMKAGYCNIVALEKSEDKKYFNMFLAFSMFTACFCTITFHTTVNPFIKILWLGESHVVAENVVMLFSIIMFGRIIINPVYIARDSKGLYKETKWSTVIQAVCNIVLSIILVQKYQIFGVLLATVISQFLILIPFNVNIIYKKIFVNDFNIFIKKIILTVVNIIILYFINVLILTYFPLYNIFTLIMFMLTIALINLIECLLVFYTFDKDFKKLTKEVLGKIRRVKK